MPRTHAACVLSSGYPRARVRGCAGARVRGCAGARVRVRALAAIAAISRGGAERGAWPATFAAARGGAEVGEAILPPDPQRS
jgi:hypothetical protein